MNRIIVPLLLILLIQCALVALVYWPQNASGPGAEPGALATANPAKVDEIRIGDEYDNEAVIRRVGELWLLPGLNNLPADSARVEALLEGILAAEPGWPVAESAAAGQRFQVADYHYKRRLALLRRDKVLDTLYLGTAPVFRKVHARNDASNAIYAIAFNSHDAPALNDAWLDPRLIQVRSPLSIAADAYSVHWQDGTWLSGTGGVPDERELEALLDALGTLQVEGVPDGDDQRELAELEADLYLEITSLQGDMTLELFTLGGKHFVFSTRLPLFFKLSAYDYDRLTGIDFDLISGAAAAPGQEAATETAL